MESWLQYRHQCAEFLRTRAQASGSKEEFAAWERYARQTARMQATAAHLARALGSAYAVANGLRVSHHGREIYLEHLVMGPTGIFLVETVEADDPLWRQDLAQNIDFFRQALGTQAAYFTCLVVCRTIERAPLPPGAHPVDSLDVAVEVIRDPRSGLTLPPALAQEVWHLIQAVEIRQQGQAPQVPVVRGRNWLEILTLTLPLFYSLVAGILDEWIAFPASLIVLGGPTVVAWLVIRRIRRERIRRDLMITVLVVGLLFFLILLIGITHTPSDPSLPGEG